MDFFRSLYAEFFKTRKTLAFWASVLLPLVICGLVCAGFYFNADKMSKNPPLILWMRYLSAIMGVMGSLILPMFVIFMTYSINAMEHRSDTWKSMFSVAVPKWTIYTAKYVYSLVIVAITLFLFCSFTLLSANLLAILKPELRFNEFSVTAYAFGVYTKLFLASLGILSVQFLFSLLWSDFLKPMGIGFVGFILGVISAGVGWKYAWTIPYAHPLLALKSLPKSANIMKDGLAVNYFTKEVVVGLIVAAVMYVLGYFVVVKRSVK